MPGDPCSPLQRTRFSPWCSLEMYGLATLALLAASVSGVSAHGGVLSYSIAGKWYDGWKAYNSPAGQSTIQRPWAT